MKTNDFKKQRLLSIAIVLTCFSILTLLAILMFSGCTVAPKILPPAASASYDGNDKNSGFIAFNADGSATITAHARDRYNSLIEKYAKNFNPPLQKDDGVRRIGDSWVIDKEHLKDFALMNRLNASAISPQ